jgi:signal transduction histidine kinase
VQVAFVRNLSVRGKIFAGYIAILLMALALLGVAVALTSQTRDLLRNLSGDTIPALIALDTLQEAGLRLTNAGDRLAFAATGATGAAQDLPKPRLTALRAAVAQSDRQFKAAIDSIRAVADVEALQAMRPRIIGSAEAMRGHAAKLLAQTDGAVDAKAIAATRNALEVESDTLADHVNRTILYHRRALTISQADVERRVRTMLVSVLVGVVVICLATIVGGKIVSGYIIRPILQLRESAARVGRGDLGVPPTKLSNDEIGTLVDTFAAMMAQLQSAQRQLMNQERLATLGQVAGTVSHELRNPLAVIRSSMTLVGQLVPDKSEGIARALERADRNIDRCAGIIEELVAFTLMRDSSREPTSLDQWVAEILDGHPPPDGIVLQRALTSAAIVALDRGQFRQVIVNLLENAGQAMTDPGWAPPRGRQPALTVRTEAAGPLVRLSVVDNGPGIPAERLPRIFEPLFTTKSFGVGLGLPTVRQIVEQHGGTIDAMSDVNDGATFVICLPRLADAARHPERTDTEAA